MGSSASEKMMMRSTARGERKGISGYLRREKSGASSTSPRRPSSPSAASSAARVREGGAPGSFGEFSRSLVLGLNGYKAHVFLARQVGGPEADGSYPLEIIIF